jgi:hypothetical protein
MATDLRALVIVDMQRGMADTATGTRAAWLRKPRWPHNRAIKLLLLLFTAMAAPTVRK